MLVLQGWDTLLQTLLTSNIIDRACHNRVLGDTNTQNKTPNQTEKKKEGQHNNKR